MSKYWTFRQNNSGGSFVVNDDLSHIVIVEANDIKQANALAESVGLYFDGAGDCRCCGNRWDEMWDEDDGKDSPEIFGEPAREFRISHSWWDVIVTIHYLDGRKERFVAEAEQ